MWGRRPCPSQPTDSRPTPSRPGSRQHKAQSPLDEATADPAARPKLVALDSLRPQRITGRTLAYDELITMLLANPFRTQREIAAETGYTESWLSRIISSDLFQTKLAERLNDTVEPERRSAVAARFGEIRDRARASLSRTLALIEERLDRPAAELDPKEVLEDGKFLAQIAGYGAKDTGQPPVQVNMNVHLQELSTNMVSLFRAARAGAPEPSSARGNTCTPIEHQPSSAPALAATPLPAQALEVPNGRSQPPPAGFPPAPAKP